MKDDQFDKLFRYIVDMDKRLQEDLEGIREDIRDLRKAPDLVAKQTEHAEVEQAARDAQFNRLVEWARKVSKKTGVPLPDL